MPCHGFSLLPLRPYFVKGIFASKLYQNKQLKILYFDTLSNCDLPYINDQLSLNQGLTTVPMTIFGGRGGHLNT